MNESQIEQMQWEGGVESILRERIAKLEKSVTSYERLLDQAYDDFHDCVDNWEVRDVLEDLVEYAPRRNWKEEER
jgi:poly(A) polymerase Pap1